LSSEIDIVKIIPGTLELLWGNIPSGLNCCRGGHFKNQMLLVVQVVNFADLWAVYKSANSYKLPGSCVRLTTELEKAKRRDITRLQYYS